MTEEEERKVQTLKRLLELVETQWKLARNEVESEHFKLEHQKLVTKIVALQKKR